jgi:hypothetical protein
MTPEAMPEPTSPSTFQVASSDFQESGRKFQQQPFACASLWFNKISLDVDPSNILNMSTRFTHQSNHRCIYLVNLGCAEELPGLYAAFSASLLQ